MVIFYKYIYTEILLCRLSWGSVLQFRTLILGPYCLSWTSWGWGSDLLSDGRVVKRTHTHIHSSCSCHRPSFSHNDISFSRILEPRIPVCGDTGLT